MNRMKLKPYPKYKDLGIKWIGRIPEEWNTERFKIRFKSKKGKIPENLEEINGKGYLPYLSMEYLRGTEDGVLFSNDPKALKVEEDDLLLLWDGSNAGEFISAKKGYLSSTMVKLSIKNMDKSYSKFLCSAFELMLRDLTIGMGIPHVNGDTLGNIRIPILEIQGQQKIASFLDTQTLKINKTIEKDKQLIELLKEKRTALINHVVTKGLDKNAKMKDSEIDWIGEIPEGWDIKKLKFVARIKTGDKNTEDHIPKGKYPFFVRSQTVERLNTYTFNGEAVLTAGDGVGVGKVFHYYNGKFDFHQRVYAITHFKEVLGKYAYYYLKNNLIKEMLKYNAKSTVDSLRLPMFLNFVMTFPKNIQQQIQIVKYLDKATSKIDNTINTIQEKIILMEEYKKSLIHHVVTGKVDVRESEV